MKTKPQSNSDMAKVLASYVGKHQGTESIYVRTRVGEDVVKSMSRNGLLRWDGRAYRITPAGLRMLADHIDSGML